jgi:hypothetical protein
MIKSLVKRVPGARKFAQVMGLVPKHVNGRRFVLDGLPKNSVGAEIGVHLGDFSKQILDVVRPRELHLIDPWKHEESPVYKKAWYGGQANDGQLEMDNRYATVRARFDGEIRQGRVKIHRGYSQDILDQIPDGYFDWIYIDGNHLYEYVKSDLQLSFRKTRPGGYITGDDYTEGGWWAAGVKKAVDELAKEDTAQLIEIRNRQFIFQKRLHDELVNGDKA